MFTIASLSFGDRLVSNANSGNNGICPPNTEVTVRNFRQMGGYTAVGVESRTSHQGWTDLNGNCPPHKGLYLSEATLIDNFELANKRYVIAHGTTFKGADISNMKCRLINKSESLKCVFVELEHNVGGGSADGCGKMGHCIPLPIDAVKLSNTKKKMMLM